MHAIHSAEDISRARHLERVLMRLALIVFGFMTRTHALTHTNSPAASLFLTTLIYSPFARTLVLYLRRLDLCDPCYTVSDTHTHTHVCTLPHGWGPPPLFHFSD